MIDGSCLQFTISNPTSPLPPCYGGPQQKNYSAFGWFPGVIVNWVILMKHKSILHFSSFNNTNEEELRMSKKFVFYWKIKKSRAPEKVRDKIRFWVDWIINYKEKQSCPSIPPMFNEWLG